MSAGTGQVTVGRDITFDVTATGSVVAFVFDEWVVNDGVQSTSLISGGLSVIKYSINALCVRTMTVAEQPVASMRPAGPHAHRQSGTGHNGNCH